MMTLGPQHIVLQMCMCVYYIQTLVSWKLAISSVKIIYTLKMKALSRERREKRETNFYSSQITNYKADWFKNVTIFIYVLLIDL